MRFFSKLLTLLLILPLVTFCGSSSDDSDSSGNTTDGTSDTTTTGNNDTGGNDDSGGGAAEVDLSLAGSCSDDIGDEFTTKVQAAIDASCVTCHVTAGSAAASFVFEAGESNAQANRDVLLAYIASDMNDDISEFNAILEGTGHPGGSQTTHLSVADSSSWWAVEEAIAAYETNIDDVASTTCALAGCHGDPINGSTTLEFESDKLEDNRQALLAILEGTGFSNAEGFVEKMDGTTSHTGGIHITNITEAEITAWWTAEQACE